ncbi:glycosyltransferase family 4 protein [bacterium]|nr:glycosyltransferase family 4 protein [bacterium]
MRILIISQYYPPEVGALATRMSDLARQLTALGHTVTVIGEIPNYPKGIIAKEYRGRLFVREKYQRTDVIRSFVLASPRKTNVERLSTYLSFMVSSVFAAAFVQRCDVVLATSPPLFVGVSGYVVSRLMGSKFVFDVRDLWPESAVYLGEMKQGAITNLAERLERFLYRKATRISIAVPGFRQRLTARLAVDDKILEFPNGVDTSLFYPREEAKDLREKVGLQDKFVVLFSGNLGLAQGLRSVLQAAKLLQNESDIVFVLVGEGVEKAKLIEERNRLGLKRILFWAAQPHARMPAIISMADVCLVPLKNLELFTTALPSKMFEYMACGRPIVSTLVGEGEALVRRANAGISVEPENAGAIADAILQLYRNRRQREELGQNGLRFVREHYTRSQIVAHFERQLVELVAHSQ